MRTVIIEDEQIAANNLKKMLIEINPGIEVVRILQSIEESVEFFGRYNDIELVFMDIQLADGLAFHIFDKVTVGCPIIFTTAYDQYALEAFKANGLDYLLKPISRDDLEHALKKHDLFTKHRENGGIADKEQIAAMMQSMQQKKYKSFFLIPMRDKLIPLDVNDIAYIYLDEKISRIITFNNEQHSIDKPLDAIFTQLDPARFFRANRQFIIAHKAIDGISLWPLSKLYISLKIPTPEKIIISRARVSEFKEWYTE